MPITGQVDISSIIETLGDKDHGLVSAGPASNTDIQDEEHVYRATWGAVDMSTSMWLEPAWSCIWDVNHYYRDLGIEWPYRPTKKDLRIAFQAVDGHSSERLTYVLMQLLDPEIRRQYDRQPFGKLMKDRYILEERMRKLSAVASEMTEASGKVVTVEDLLDGDPGQQGERPQSIKELRSADPDNWTWGYYLLKSRKTEYEDLKEWQKYLSLAFHQRGLVRIISIGYIGKTKDPFVIRNWNGKTIVFLNDEVSPSLELAETVVSKIVPSTEGIPACQHQQSLSPVAEAEQQNKL